MPAAKASTGSPGLPAISTPRLLLSSNHCNNSPAAGHSHVAAADGCAAPSAGGIEAIGCPDDPAAHASSEYGVRPPSGSFTTPALPPEAVSVLLPGIAIGRTSTPLLPAASPAPRATIRFCPTLSWFASASRFQLTKSLTLWL